VQFALILLLLFGTGCRPAELVNAKKKRKDDVGFEDDDFEVVDDNNILSVDKSDDGFSAENNKDHSGRDDALEGDIAVSGVEEDIRHYDAICYEDVRLLVVRSPGSEERDVLAMEVTMAHHKGHKRRPKP
jgi:hypothetical protein